MATSCKVGVHSKRDGCEKFESSVDSKEGKEKNASRHVEKSWHVIKSVFILLKASAVQIPQLDADGSAGIYHATFKLISQICVILHKKCN